MPRGRKIRKFCTRKSPTKHTPHRSRIKAGKWTDQHIVSLDAELSQTIITSVELLTTPSLTLGIDIVIVKLLIVCNFSIRNTLIHITNTAQQKIIDNDQVFAIEERSGEGNEGMGLYDYYVRMKKKYRNVNDRNNYIESDIQRFYPTRMRMSSFKDEKLSRGSSFEL